MMKICIIGSILPFRSGIARHTTAIARELLGREDVELSVISFMRRYPRFLYPGAGDLEPDANPPSEFAVDFCLDSLNSLSWKRPLGVFCARLPITGTCLEYGITNGPLSEAMPAAPTLPYAMAKDALRRRIEERMPPAATLIWARLFYMHGPGQNPRSVLALLDAAVDRGDPVFLMS